MNLEELNSLLDELFLCDPKADGAGLNLHELKKQVEDLITKEIKQARIDGAKEYNRVLTDNLGKCEYTAIDDGVVGIYRQEIVGQAVRKANDKTIMSLSSPNGLNKD